MNNANIIPPGVTVFCDPSLVPVLRGFDAFSRAQTAAPLAVLSTTPAGMLAQIQRHTRNDVLFTLSTAMDSAVQSGFVVPATRKNGFTNTLVLACRAGRYSPLAPAALPTLLAGARLAVTDDTPASSLDGRAVLKANGLTAARVQGVANTGDAAFLVTTGAADIALIYRTEAQADPHLMVLAELRANPALTDYSAAVNSESVSPNAQILLALLSSASGASLLRNAGLGVAA